jgi:ribonuclease E
MNSQHLIINSVHPEEFRVALVDGQSLSEFFIETNAKGKFVGNIYKGIIVHIQPSLQAAFVNYGVERNGFLPLSEIHPEYYQQEVSGDPSSIRIQDVVLPGQEVLVQVVKEEIGNKGAVLTTYISLAGRNIVLMPGQSQRGVSRKIEDEAQREKLKELAHSLKVPDNFGIIIRTMAEDRTKRDITKDLNYLIRLWEEIRKRVQETPSPALIYKERDLAIRVVRDYFSADVKSILIDDKDIYRSVKEFVHIVSPKHEQAVKLFKEDGPIFAKYNVEDQIDQIFRKKVYLKSGGYLVIEPTEALVTIDVNSGRANKDEELEEMVYKVNMEAATEIPRQLRLRDLGGLIVVDFIDMRDRRHIREVERRLREEIKRDKAKVTVGRISRFGLLELSRQHLGLNIQLGSYRECPHCQGAGMVRAIEATALYYLRKIWLTLAQKGNAATVKGVFCPEVASYLLNQKRSDVIQLEEKYNVSIYIEGVAGSPQHEGKLDWTWKDAPVQPPEERTPARCARQ